MGHELRVLALTGGERYPSARYRVRQYIQSLRREDIVVDERPLPWEQYQPRRRLLRPLWMLGTFCSRFPHALATYGADLTLMSREMLPAFIPVDRLTKQPRVLDVDDAIWLNRGGQRAKVVAKHCRRVICGNHYLADYFQQWNENVTVVPTAVDTEVIRPVSGGKQHLTIGWTGSAENLIYVYAIEDALRNVLLNDKRARLLIVSNRAPQFKDLPSDQVAFIPWTPDGERKAFNEMSVGIMPLPDTDWAKGKCSFKMLCYMAAGLPVVVSPVGMNQEVLDQGRLGFSASTLDDWTDALRILLRESDLAAQMGRVGREVAVESYSVKAVAPLLASALRKAADQS